MVHHATQERKEGERRKSFFFLLLRDREQKISEDGLQKWRSHFFICLSLSLPLYFSHFGSSGREGKSVRKILITLPMWPLKLSRKLCAKRSPLEKLCKFRPFCAISPWGALPPGTPPLSRKCRENVAGGGVVVRGKSERER